MRAEDKHSPSDAQKKTAMQVVGEDDILRSLELDPEQELALLIEKRRSDEQVLLENLTIQSANGVVDAYTHALADYKAKTREQKLDFYLSEFEETFLLTKTITALANQNVVRISDFLSLEVEELFNIERFGHNSYREVYSLLIQLGFKNILHLEEALARSKVHLKHSATDRKYLRSCILSDVFYLETIPLYYFCLNSNELAGMKTLGVEDATHILKLYPAQIVEMPGAVIEFHKAPSTYQKIRQAFHSLGILLPEYANASQDKRLASQSSFKA